MIKQLLIFSLASSMIITMEPPRKKQKVGEEQAAEQTFGQFQDLPKEIQGEIVYHLTGATSLEEASNNIRSMMLTNQKWNKWFNSDTGTKGIIYKLAQHFNVTLPTAALYLGTKNAKNWLDTELKSDSLMKIILLYSFQEVVRLFSATKRSLQIIKEIIDRGGKFVQGITRDAQGAIIYADIAEDKIILKRILPHGQPDTTFTIPPIQTINPQLLVRSIVVRNNGNILIGYYNFAPPTISSYICELMPKEKNATEYVLNREFADKGTLSLPNSYLNGLRSEGKDLFIIAENNTNGTPYIMRYSFKSGKQVTQSFASNRDENFSAIATHKNFVFLASSSYNHDKDIYELCLKKIENNFTATAPTQQSVLCYQLEDFDTFSADLLYVHANNSITIGATLINTVENANELNELEDFIILVLDDQGNELYHYRFPL